jgi:hypothetical protein
LVKNLLPTTENIIIELIIIKYSFDIFVERTGNLNVRANGEPKKSDRDGILMQKRAFQLHYDLTNRKKITVVCKSEFWLVGKTCPCTCDIEFREI